MDQFTTFRPANRSLKQAIWRGARGKCPACGKGHIFRTFMKVADTCGCCGEELYHQRADDAPPYFTIFIVGHVVIPLVFVVERVWEPSYVVHAALWLPLILGLTYLLMPLVKGAVVGLQWALRMHGFGIEHPNE
jgi:uncharacterized protein (DUF983 family)